MSNRFATTVTSNSSVAERPPGSVAVTVTVDRPTATAVTMIESPEIAAPAAALFEDVWDQVRSSPSGSVKMSGRYAR